MKNNEQNFYDRGFNDVEHLSQLVVFESCRMGFMEGWMATVGAFNLPKTSPFRDPN